MASKLFTLAKEEELRVEAEGDRPVVLTLRSGTGEIFGCEVALNQRVTLYNEKVALFSWRVSGRRLESERERGRPPSLLPPGSPPASARARRHGATVEVEGAADIACARPAAPRPCPASAPLTRARRAPATLPATLRWIRT